MPPEPAPTDKSEIVEKSAEKSAESDAKPTLSEQIADILLKFVMAGGVAGGGFGAFWSLFKDSNVPKAIASAVIGLGISYAAKMMQPIDEGNRRRLEKAGKAVDQALDRATDQVFAKATGFEEKYLHCQALDCQDYKTDGMEQRIGIFTPLLREVFVPLKVGGDLMQSRFCAEIGETEEDGLLIWDLLKLVKQQPVYRQMAILALGGYGKTTLMKHITFSYAEGHYRDYGAPKLVPVLLYLRKWRKLLAQPNPPNLPDLITKCHIPDLPRGADLAVPPNWAKDLLRSGRAIVMLDGFDEVAAAERVAVSQWISQQMRQYDQSVFILTSRPGGYQFYAAEKPRMAVTVQPFNEDQRQRFVRQWYLCQERYARAGRNTPDVEQQANRSADELLAQIKQRQELQDMAKNPLLLNMIATFHRTYPGAKLPQRRTELYRDICTLQLQNRPSARNVELLLEAAERQKVLQGLALEMMQRQLERIQYQELLPLLQRLIDPHDDTVKAAEFLQQMVQVSELLVEREPEEYEFSHLSFQEYLASVEVKDLRQETLLYPHLNEAWWESTIRLYAAQVNPANLINLINLIRAALDHEAFHVAYLCWRDASDTQKRRFDSALVAEVKTKRFLPLENLLRNEHWKDADYETYRLMITTVGKEVGGYFTSAEELRTFPCEELLTIDRLWVQYSRGLFGFSVQKQIYVECGGKLDGNYPGDEIWTAFGERIGWRQNGEWLSYSDLNPSFSVKEGNFPSIWGLCEGWFVCSLLSHPDL